MMLCIELEVCYKSCESLHKFFCGVNRGAAKNSRRSGQKDGKSTWRHAKSFWGFREHNPLRFNAVVPNLFQSRTPFRIIIKLTDPHVFMINLKQILWSTKLAFANANEFRCNIVRRIKQQTA